MRIITQTGFDHFSGRSLSKPAYYIAHADEGKMHGSTGALQGPYESREQAEIAMLKDKVSGLKSANESLNHKFNLLVQLIAPDALNNPLGVGVGLITEIEKKKSGVI